MNFRHFLIENADNQCVKISWEYHPYITFEDIIFISCYGSSKFTLSEEYENLMVIREDHPEILDVYFKHVNAHNIILLFLLINNYSVDGFTGFEPDRNSLITCLEDLKAHGLQAGRLSGIICDIPGSILYPNALEAYFENKEESKEFKTMMKMNYHKLVNGEISGFVIGWDLSSSISIEDIGYISCIDWYYSKNIRFSEEYFTPEIFEQSENRDILCLLFILINGGGGGGEAYVPMLSDDFLKTVLNFFEEICLKFCRIAFNLRYFYFENETKESVESFIGKYMAKRIPSKSARNF